MKKIKTSILALALLFGVAVVAPSAVVLAQTPSEQMQQGVDSIGGKSAKGFEWTVKRAIDVFLYVIGALSVIMIIYGGFKYITSSGEASAVTSAKNTIMYALIGLVVAAMALTIANIVLGIVDPDGSGTGAGSGVANGAINSANDAVNGSSSTNTGSGTFR